MKYIYIILVLILGCSKSPDAIKVQYQIEHFGDGVAYCHFDNQPEIKQISNETFDTSFVAYRNGYDLRFEIFYDYSIVKEQKGHLKLKILIDNEIVKEKELYLIGCIGYRGQLYYSEKEW